MKCVFVGYSRTQKGYKCFHPPSQKFSISADVPFFESTLYFSPHGSSLDESIVEALAPIPVFSLLESSSSSPPTLDELVVSQGVDTSTSTPINQSNLFPNLPFPHHRTHTLVLSTWYLIDQYVSFAYLPPSYRAFTASLSSVSIPPSLVEAMAHPDLRVAMEEEIHAL